MWKLLLIVASFLCISCVNNTSTSVKNHKYTNDLINESSPYLLQHAHNPVNWKPWGEEALQEANRTNKLMIVSVGYAACHWCHVMERESFEDSIVARAMNDNYVSIKVDREERPDIDQTYINAVQLMTGNAGWPLNVITLPDGRPVFGGTYFQKEEWLQALEQIQELYVEEPKKLIDYAARLEEGIKTIDLVQLNTDKTDFTEFDTQALLQRWEQSFDTVYGGRKGAPKFMMPNQLKYFLQRGTNTKNQALLDYVDLTLTKMAYGGLYDHVGGGFARYSTDEKWHVPHFEKMLYDNAQLVSLYSEAYKKTQNPLYSKVVHETLAYVAREMTNKEGTFYSSLDADSLDENGNLEEGAFYSYEAEELNGLNLKEKEIFDAYYNINDEGLWKEENKYVLFRTQNHTEICQQFSISETYLNELIASWKSALFNYRASRPKTRLDDKSLTSWNALMISGYVDAYKAFQNDDYKLAAIKNAQFIANQQTQNDGSLFHTYKDGKSSISGYLEDYATVINAYMDLYEITFDATWLHKAKQLTDYTFEHFFDNTNKMFYFTSSKEETILSRNIEYRDNVISSSNSIIANNLWILSHHYDNTLYRETASQMLRNVLPEIEQYPSSFPNWMTLLEKYQSPFYEVVIMGENSMDIRSEMNQKYLPEIMLAGSATADTLPLLKGRHVANNTMVYVCVNNTCKLPVTDFEKAYQLIKQ